MAGAGKRNTGGSPMDLVFAETTPGGAAVVGFALKRKYDDSGYITPCSSSRSKHNFSIDSSETCDEVFTPVVKDAKKRLLTSRSHSCSGVPYGYTPSVGEAYSYSDFLDASFYTEPMETTATTCGSSRFTNTLDSPSTPASRLEPALSTSMENLAFTSKAEMSPRKSRDLGMPIAQKKRGRSRSLAGFGKLDILYQLGEKSDYSVAVTKILGYLSDKDISNMTMVSSTWKHVCLRDDKTKGRWLNYIQERKERKENLGAFVRGAKKTGTTPLLNRNHSTPLQTRQPTSPPVSPAKIRFHMFRKEAQKLKSDEVLMQCPRCQKPSACTPSQKMGQCKCISCQMRFCTACRCDYHEGRPCPGYTTPVTASPRKRSTTTIGSKESRRNLRRL